MNMPKVDLDIPDVEGYSYKVKSIYQNSTRRVEQRVKQRVKYKKSFFRPYDKLDSTFDFTQDFLNKKIYARYLRADDFGEVLGEEAVATPESNSLSDILKVMVHEILSSKWLSTELAHRVANILISEIATKFGCISKTLFHREFNAIQNQLLVLTIFKVLHGIKNEVIFLCKDYYETICKKSIFSESTNNERLCSYFRGELSKRVDTLTILKHSVKDIQLGNLKKQTQITDEEKLNNQVEEVKKKLNNFISPKVAFHDLALQVESYWSTKKSLAKDDKIRTSKSPVYNPNKTVRIFSGDIGSEERNEEHPNTARSAYSREDKRLIFDLSERNMEWIEQDIRHLVKTDSSDDDEFDLNRDRTDPLLTKAHLTPYARISETFSCEQADTNLKKDSELDLDDLLTKNGNEEQDINSNLESALIKAFEDRPVSRRERFLTPTGLRRKNESKLNFDNVTLRPRSKKSRNNMEPTFKESKFQKNRVLRVIECRFSNRQHQGSINLSPDNLINISEFEEESPLEDIEKLDELQSAVKELGDLYDTFIGLMPKDPLSLDEDVDDLHLCVTAPADMSVTEMLSSQFNGRRPLGSPKRRPKRRLSASEKHPMLERNNVADPSILAALNSGKLNKSTRHPLAKFNYGGYIPSELKLKDDQANQAYKASQINMTDYLDYLQEFNNDFLDSCILEKFLIDLQEEEKQKAIVKQEQELIEEERKKKEELERMERQRKKEMLEYRAGEWNTGIVDYLREFNNHDSNVSLQIILEKIWTKLEVPLTQKIEMAVKYGDHRIQNSAFRKRLDDWLETAEQIRKRESLLMKIKKFEDGASTPTRFFTQSSKYLSRESRKREHMLDELHKLDFQVTELIDRIEKDSDEVVTFQGKNYQQKMKTDYTEILYQNQQERKSK